MKKSAKSVETSKSPTPPVSTSVPAVRPEIVVKPHEELFSRAMRLFHQGHYDQALPLFVEAAATGPAGPLTETARMYSRMCQQRLHQEAASPRTPEEHYNFGIRLLNERRLDDALSHLKEALAGGELGSHVHYALALASGLKGDSAAARSSLREAMRLDPKLRNLARQDPDFRPLLEDGEIRRMLQEESVPHS